MKCLALALVAALVAAAPAHAVTAKLSRKVSCGAAGEHRRPGAISRGGVLKDGRVIYPEILPPCEHVFDFRMEVETLGGPPRLSYGPGGRPMMLLHPGTRYSVTLHNPMPVRVAVNLTVDGLNTISGEPGTPSGGSKWLIPPHSRITVSGWQVGPSTARQFVVTSKQASYARWRSDEWARDLSVNCGVIGAAYFWNSHELAAALIHQHPRPLALGKPGALGRRPAVAAQENGGPAFNAGTGMGERLANPVRAVQFHADAGMYDPDEALVVFYDFDDRRILRPEPVQPDVWREKPRYAPEMPRAYER